MPKMEINRRQFIGGVGACFLGWGAQASTYRDLFAAARQDKNGRYSLAIFDPEHGDVAQFVLPERGHDVCAHPHRKECVIFARRPGRFAVALNYDKKLPPISFNARSDRHFYGHGVFSPDGKLLYSTENDYEKGQGVIGVRDASNGYTQIGEFLSHGIGPHDLAFLPDGKTLVVANGGLLTHPDTGRRVLNLADMSPSLCYVDCATGDLIERQSLSKALSQLSIRHLCVTDGDMVVFGCQYKGPDADYPPLIGFHKLGKEIQLVRAHDLPHRAMRNYVGSITVDKSGTLIAASSPKGGLVTYWDVPGQRFLGQTQIKDGCGVAATHKKGHFLLTSGFGQTVRVDGALRRIIASHQTGYAWDNHVVRLKM